MKDAPRYVTLRDYLRVIREGYVAPGDDGFRYIYDRVRPEADKPVAPT